MEIPLPHVARAAARRTLATDLERTVKPHGTAARAAQEKRYLKSDLDLTAKQRAAIEARR